MGDSQAVRDSLVRDIQRECATYQELNDRRGAENLFYSAVFVVFVALAAAVGGAGNMVGALAAGVATAVKVVGALAAGVAAAVKVVGAFAAGVAAVATVKAALVLGVVAAAVAAGWVFFFGEPQEGEARQEQRNELVD
jgi:hypothetical protein